VGKPKPKMKTYRGYHPRALCDDCGWECWAKNAHGAGAIHAKSHEHTVHVEIELSYTYTPEGSEYDKR